MNFKSKIILLIFIIFTLLLSVNSYIKSATYCYDITNNKKFNLELNKIILVGDSRMELIEMDKDKLNIPDTIIFNAKSGAKIEWLYNIGIPQLYKNINVRDEYNYTVVFNLGVNDLDSNLPAEVIAKEYFMEYKKIIKTFKNVSFYILSVNPVDVDKITKFFYVQERNNKRIENFNNYFITKLKEEKFENVKYCDSYNTLNFTLPDGLHYDFDTNKNIINYIINDCTNINNYLLHTIYW